MFHSKLYNEASHYYLIFLRNKEILVCLLCKENHFASSSKRNHNNHTCKYHKVEKSTIGDPKRIFSLNEIKIFQTAAEVSLTIFFKQIFFYIFIIIIYHIFYKNKIDTLLFQEARERETPVKKNYITIIDSDTKKIYFKCIVESCKTKVRFFSYNQYSIHFFEVHGLKKKTWLLRSEIEKYGDFNSNIVKDEKTDSNVLKVFIHYS